MATEPNAILSAPPSVVEDAQHDFDFPRREAACFYGLFLRGHSAEELRRDIEVPPAVLAIFEALLDTDLRPQRVQ